MRNLILIAVAVVMVLAVPTYGVSRYFQPTSGSWQVPANWNTALDGSGTAGVPTTADKPKIRSGNTAIVDTSNCVGLKPYIGYYNVGLGHMQIVAGGTLTLGEKLIQGNVQLASFGPCTAVQTGGTYTAYEGMYLGAQGSRTDVLEFHPTELDYYGNPVPIFLGWGTWTISGGLWESTNSHSTNGLRCGHHYEGSSGSPGMGYIDAGGTPVAIPSVGEFTVDGDGGTINVAGFYIQHNTSKTKFILTSSGAVSTINVGTHATMTGTLEVDDTAYTGSWSIGDTIDLIVCGADTDLTYRNVPDGQFWDPDAATPGYVAFSNPDLVMSGPNALGLPGGPNLGFRPTDDGAGTLQVIYTALGDADTDGDVDDGDLSLLLVSFGNTGKSWGNGDFDGDGNVNDSDLSLLLMNFGSGTGQSAVPEPATLCLLGLGAIGLLRRRRR